MIRHYITVGLRIMNRQKSYSMINIAGLSLAMTCCIFIFLWVKDELSYDRFQKNSDQLYRVIFNYEKEGKSQQHWRTPPPLSRALKSKYPEILDATRFHSQPQILVTHGQDKYWQTVGFTDPAVFDLFSIEFVKGSPDRAFSKPHSIILTESMAARYFGDNDPMNQIMTLDRQRPFTVTGVIRDYPQNSILQFDMLTQFEHLEEVTGMGNTEEWGDFGYHTFLHLPADIHPDAFSEKIRDFLQTVSPHFKYRLAVQRISDIRLYGLNQGGTAASVYIFSIIAVFVLLIACVNFMNLTTARSAKRAKEIGVRKTAGAGRSDLIRQFFGESILTAFVAMLIAPALTFILTPVFNELSGKNLSFDPAENPFIIPALIGIALITGALSGVYPALYLSSLRPTGMLKNAAGRGAARFRQSLVVFQFSISVSLIIGTVTVRNQLQFIQRQNLGFDRENIVYMPFSEGLKKNYETFKNELLKHSGISHVSAMSNKTGTSRMWSMNISEWEGNKDQRKISLGLIYVDYDFLGMFGMTMSEGRFYSRSFGDDQANVVLNESAVKAMGLEHPVGKRTGKDGGVIIGVVKDFNFASLHSPIEPLGLMMDPQWYSQLAVKIISPDLPEAIGYIRSRVEAFSPDTPFEYHFLNDDLDRLYASDQKTGMLLNYFALLAVIISCLGLFGLASFIAEQRTKEIGVRKILGASAAGIMSMLSGQFIKWVVLSNALAWPVAYYVMSQWLGNFAYQADLGFEIFLLTGLMTLGIALLVIGGQVLKAARANPVESLRYE